MTAKTRKRYKWAIEGCDDELGVQWEKIESKDDEWDYYYDTKAIAKQHFIEDCASGLNNAMRNIRIYKGRLEAAKKLK